MPLFNNNNNNKTHFLWSSFPNPECALAEVLLLQETNQQTSPQHLPWAGPHPHGVSYSSGVSGKPWWPSPVSSFQLSRFVQPENPAARGLRATVFPALAGSAALLCDKAAEAERWRSILKIFTIDSVKVRQIAFCDTGLHIQTLSLLSLHWAGPAA